MKSDAEWMELALAEARKGIGRTAPNPPVGSVIVKDDVLLGSGYHHAAGRPHAEREALADVFIRHGNAGARGATAYVTLEPCSTHGRTPPCTDGLIEAGISRVVYATVDRNPSHAGRADSILRDAGIEIASGILKEKADRILLPFFKVKETGLPWIIWKTAMSLDGRITRPPGEGQWLTGPDARLDVQKLRSTVDAILTTGETVRRDHPALTIRVPELLEGRTQPWRVIFTDHPSSLPVDAPLLSDEWRHRTLIRPRSGIAESLRALVRDQGVLSVMIEAGGVFSAAMIGEGLIDEAVIYYAPMLCGGPSPGLAGAGLEPSLKMKDVSFRQLGGDIRISGLVDR
ncbi:bifunctional diaminohydroxyphosphoribosylaminopyrimidine deaminase/5-amino-6-(5-phosphoribosylamino)uracil reductase RibD [Luteolibacter sp. SL250]|uniref:bifunctional diaminohydroxyphosphoribosylaminopyrimidine deaminase/5-amino-6-(5-phosphoribosylamino)uracil reductase RibD n=1 Tax=Luteolibacter sp. SL250 TaxID=2995170 RepID=UPI00226F595F|nr:bifunctional diaminohydroxyphosphoribosylaminopyrimidine deaminase/5-amino-6-(5-phosphoribosylamino)uracil reductase RibD [Luteolibacter sp. SL250]WAC19807.1 bifunctional diaminohydroxyphosphoribosylaminopyrimidine deaminase/5-amino-6-(5-phosphoribosylamino)uracil reductase RibD [Luteolibacter sp. SL250]